uniref:DUF6818 domain-containing protein n=1 Tax=Phytophthora fragariae TaxID=53985 RepID=A0A6A3DCU7_9STRA|nr:hypothetical protein PF009_g32282 [Phytophthora fragariae]
MPEISRLLAVVEELLPLGRDEWERVTIAYNSNRSRSWAERDLDSLRRKFNALYSARKPTGTADMLPHIKKAKLTKLAIDEKANVVEMDDAADQDPDEDSATGDQRCSWSRATVLSRTTTTKREMVTGISLAATLQAQTSRAVTISNPMTLRVQQSRTPSFPPRPHFLSMPPAPSTYNLAPRVSTPLPQH